MGETVSLLQLNHISKTFPAVVALDDVEFNLRQGEIHALLGENGAGKSTLIKVLTGVEQRNSGTVLLEDREIFPQTPYDAQLEGISTVYQEVNLCPNLTVAENIYIGRQPKIGGQIDWKNINKQAKALLLKFGIDIDVTRTLDCYSVAIQQMVAIARAVDISAKVLILDEPTSSLTAVEVDKLFETMRMLKDQGMGIIFVTHFLDQVYAVSDRITVLRNGKYIGCFKTKNLPRVDLIGKMIGKEYANLDQALSSKEELISTQAYLKMSHITGNNAVADMNLEINRGEVTGLSGLLGSGRSEVARLIFCIDQIESGEMTLDGKKVELKNPLSAIRSGFAFCPENRKTEGIIGDLSVRDNIILALQAKQGMFKTISPSEAEKLAQQFIAELEIKTPSSFQLVKNLSGGNQQKVILARWLATNPNLLMLDEPTRGIDIGTKAEIQKIVVDLARKGMALLFISSEIDEMMRCCDRIFVLRDKKKVAELSRGEITESEIMNQIAGGDQLG